MQDERGTYWPLHRELPITMIEPHCTGGSCRQGRDKCETPEACGLALSGDGEIEEVESIATAGLIALLAVVSFGFIVGFASFIYENFALLSAVVRRLT